LPGQTWKNLIIDVGDLLEKYIGAEFKSITRIEISGFFRLRRVFLFRDGQIDHDNTFFGSNDLSKFDHFSEH